MGADVEQAEVASGFGWISVEEKDGGKLEAT